jgi:protein-disulfide isomerase
MGCYAAAMRKPLPLAFLVITLLAVVGLSDVHAKPTAGALRGPIPVTAADGSWGSANAPVTIVSFTDLQCPFCARLHKTIHELQKDYGPSKLRVVYKSFPLAFHKEARPAAEAAIAVRSLHGPKAYWRFVDEAFDKLPGSRGGDTTSVLGAIGVKSRAIQRALSRGKVADQVDADIALGKQIGVRGTPATFVNGVMLSGAQPKTKFADLIDEQLAAAKAMRARGVPATRVSVELTKKNFVTPDKKKKKPASTAKPVDNSVWKVPVGNAPTLGPKDALVTLVVFSEFQCPFCSRVRPTLMALRKKYGRDLRIAFKHNPLPFHKRAPAASTLALEAYARKGNKGFWAAHDKLFANQRALEDFDLEQYAKQLGLNPTLTMAAIRNGKHDKTIDRDQALAQDVEAGGTPHSFINGRRLSGSQPITKFEALIDEELAKARALVRAGTPRASVYAKIIKNGKTAGPPEKKTIPRASKHSPIKGNARAKVTLTMFTDYQCPFCGRAMRSIEQIEKAYPGKVKFVFRHKPLPFHKDAMLAHEAAAEAYRQKGAAGFWKMTELLFDDQKNLRRADLEAHATSLGLNMRAFGQALDSGRHKKSIERDIKISEDAGIRGTPGFVINGYFVSGAQPFAKFKRVIDRALAEAK